jgi:hypothetical protein
LSECRGRLIPSSAATRTFGERLIDLEEDKAAKAVIWGLMRVMERWRDRAIALKWAGQVGGPTVPERGSCLP